MEVKVKKRIAPTFVAAAKPPAEEVEDAGPKGPRRKKVTKISKEMIRQARKMPKHLSKVPKHSNPWVHHVKLFAEKNKLRYGCALSDPKIKEGYTKGKFTDKEDIPLAPSCSTSAQKREREQKPKRKKSQGEAKEAERHLKRLKKLGIGDEESLKKRRVARFDDIFAAYNKPFDDKIVF